jgi:hypothetical protein
LHEEIGKIICWGSIENERAVTNKIFRGVVPSLKENLYHW